MVWDEERTYVSEERSWFEILRTREDGESYYVSYVLRKYHDELGHFGLEKTYGTLDKIYWFPQMRTKIKSYIQKCISFSPGVGRPEGLLHSISKGNLPFQTIHIDHMGPLDRKLFVKQHILVVVDAFTKFTKLYATKTMASREAVEALKQYLQIIVVRVP